MVCFDLLQLGGVGVDEESQQLLPIPTPRLDLVYQSSDGVVEVLLLS